MLRPFSQMEEVEVVAALVSPLLALRIKILHLAISIRKLHLVICIFSCWVGIAIVLLLFLASAAIQPESFPLYSHFVLLAELPVEVEFRSVIICLVLAMTVGSEEIFAIFGSYERFLWLMHIVSVVCVAIKASERNLLRYPTQSQFLVVGVHLAQLIIHLHLAEYTLVCSSRQDSQYGSRRCIIFCTRSGNEFYFIYQLYIEMREFGRSRLLVVEIDGGCSQSVYLQASIGGLFHTGYVLQYIFQRRLLCQRSVADTGNQGIVSHLVHRAMTCYGYGLNLGLLISFCRIFFRLYRVCGNSKCREFPVLCCCTGGGG